MGTPLVSTKLSMPPLRPDLVPRPRLIERMDEVLRAERGLGLVSGPAGFGKTTLVAVWLRQLRSGTAPSDVAWLSLDEGDSDPARFLAYLLAALRSVDPAMGQIADEIAQPPPRDRGAAAHGSCQRHRSAVTTICPRTRRLSPDHRAARPSADDLSSRASAVAATPRHRQPRRPSPAPGTAARARTNRRYAPGGP